MTDVTVEVAIGALRQAERPMHIDPEGLDPEGLCPEALLCRVSLAQDKPPLATGRRAPDAIGLRPTAAGRASLRWSSHRRCACDHRAERSGHSRSLCGRAAATPTCRRCGLRTLRDAHRATQRTTRRQNARAAAAAQLRRGP